MTRDDLVARIVKLTGKCEDEAHGSIICFDDYDWVADTVPNYTDKQILKRLKAMGYL